ncbi:MAG: sigma-70 family RNA polymerase sigma factor [candidate division KSB1 bacterium]|nr:sigma-70 family RNA polymerase sigma factor [candidate division KSB1 bacterium]MDZ7367673.1 sigma-70 family RNA polymerase sigma factor [candidate division KSB1 bacterium]MDZ7404812.1 sigma-70 family RNA polymerase sigma factor [candidate division KSB1 bacterium]
MFMDLQNLPNTQLIKLCAEAPDHREAWLLFHQRFDRSIRLFILRECKRKDLTANRSQFEEIFNDLVQDVYLKLVQNNCRALRNYKALNEDSIYQYLAIIARNAVRGYLTKVGAKKRRAKLISLDTPVAGPQENENLRLIDVVPDAGPSPDASLEAQSEQQELDWLLEQIVTGASKERDILIYKLHYEEGFSPEQIVEHCGIALSDKRIRNIITEIKQKIIEARQSPKSKTS